jgi:hypothetical protein
VNRFDWHHDLNLFAVLVLFALLRSSHSPIAFFLSLPNRFKVKRSTCAPLLRLFLLFVVCAAIVGKPLNSFTSVQLSFTKLSLDSNRLRSLPARLIVTPTHSTSCFHSLPLRLASLKVEPIAHPINLHVTQSFAFSNIVST